MKKFSGEFELFSIDVRRIAQGNKMHVTFRMEEDKSVEKKLIDFRDEFVLLEANQIVPPESVAEVISIKSKFIVKEIKVKSSRNGNSLYFVAEQDYEKENELKFIELRFQDVILNMVPTEPDLPFNEENEDPDFGDIEVEK